MRVGICQLDQVWENQSANIENITDMIKNVNGLDLLVFPEMTLSGFSMSPNASSLLDEHHQFFSEIAKVKQANVIYGGVDESQNCLFQISREGTRVGRYAKRHLFALDGESESYSGGSDSTVLHLDGVTIIPAICYDIRFAYQLWAQAADAQAAVVIANWPQQRQSHWETLLKARAIENQMFVIACNRVGSSPSQQYVWGSMVISPLGEVLATSSRQEILLCDFDITEVKNVREKLPFLRDRQTSGFSN